MQEYQMSMARSFCCQIDSQMGDDCQYIEGPGGLGITTHAKGNRAFNYCVGFVESRASHGKPLYLAGYSRGGACVIQVAKWLNDLEAPIMVRALFLFDPVARDLSLNANGIPPNVQNVYVLFRDQTIEEVNVPWKPNYGYGTGPDKDIYARKWMGNCDVTPNDPSRTHLESTTIPQASHGAAGGVPWTDRAADEKATKDAAEWMTARMRKHIPVQLKEMWFVHKRAGAK